MITAYPSSCSLPPPAAGLPDKFIKSRPTGSRYAAAPADYAIDHDWCHHKVIESCQECPLHSKGSELPQQMESALTIHIVQVNSQILLRCHHLNGRSMDVHLCAGLSVPVEIHCQFFGLPALSWRWFRWHQSTNSNYVVVKSSRRHQHHKHRLEVKISDCS